MSKGCLSSSSFVPPIMKLPGGIHTNLMPTPLVKCFGGPCFGASCCGAGASNPLARAATRARQKRRGMAEPFPKEAGLRRHTPRIAASLVAFGCRATDAECHRQCTPAKGRLPRVPAWPLQVRLLSIQLPQLPRPQRQPEDGENHEPDAELERRHGPKPHALDERPIDARPPHGKQPPRVSGHDGEVDEPQEGEEANGDQDDPPSGDGGSPDLVLECLVHGLPPPPPTRSSTVSPAAPLHGPHSLRYCNSSRIFVRASSLVGAVTSTWPVDEPVCQASHLPLARRETVQGSCMGVPSGCPLAAAASARSYRPPSRCRRC